MMARVKPEKEFLGYMEEKGIGRGEGLAESEEANERLAESLASRGLSDQRPN